MKNAGSWWLRSYLAALLVITVLVTFAMVGTALLLLRVPQIEQSNKIEVIRETEELAQRVDILLGSLESRMQTLSEVLDLTPLARATTLLDRVTWSGRDFRAVYLVSDAGLVLTAGIDPSLGDHIVDLVGSDLSANALFRTARNTRQTVWGDKYLSALTGAVTVGLATPVGRDRILLAEVPLDYVLNTVQVAAGQRTSWIWLVDRLGEVVANTQGEPIVGTVNMLNSPLIQAARESLPLPEVFEVNGRHFYPSVSRSDALKWYFIGGMPAGLENSEVRGTFAWVVAAFTGAVLVALLMAPFWAAWLTRPLGHIVARAGQITLGVEVEAWPRSRIKEFNNLSADLEKMSATLQEREQKFQAIFNASPVPMTVTDVDRQFVLLDVNDAWCRAFGYQREHVLGCTGIAIGMVSSANMRNTAMKDMQGDSLLTEDKLLKVDGTPVLCQIYGRMVQIGQANLMIWATIDVGESRRISNELSVLNTELEARVVLRTEALATANEELSGTITVLRETQGELVRVEKMAALGGLVAGVAHELNTPLGNGLMAVTTLGDEVRKFRESMQAGLRRTALESLLASVEQATYIATRNLHRASDLVSSFKQVAADQTSSQRRPFDLREVVDEMVVSLRPSFSRTPYRIEIEVAQGLRLDSYPGPLGQVIGNLMNNAVLHGFEGRSHGTIRITGAQEDGVIELRVVDDGQGIPAGLLARIFAPFMTTKMGRGGTGLGLHIAYNVVTNLLGGSLTVHSVEGEGAAFELRLPRIAPTASVAV